jgi:hypothetical protein
MGDDAGVASTLASNNRAEAARSRRKRGGVITITDVESGAKHISFTKQEALVKLNELLREALPGHRTITLYKINAAIHSPDPIAGKYLIAQDGVSKHDAKPTKKVDETNVTSLDDFEKNGTQDRTLPNFTAALQRAQDDMPVGRVHPPAPTAPPPDVPTLPRTHAEPVLIVMPGPNPVGPGASRAAPNRTTTVSAEVRAMRDARFKDVTAARRARRDAKLTKEQKKTKQAAEVPGTTGMSAAAPLPPSSTHSMKSPAQEAKAQPQIGGLAKPANTTVSVGPLQGAVLRKGAPVLTQQPQVNLDSHASRVARSANWRPDQSSQRRVTIDDNAKGQADNDANTAQGSSSTQPAPPRQGETDRVGIAPHQAEAAAEMHTEGSSAARSSVVPTPVMIDRQAMINIIISKENTVHSQKDGFTWLPQHLESSELIPNQGHDAVSKRIQELNKVYIQKVNDTTSRLEPVTNWMLDEYENQLRFMLNIAANEVADSKGKHVPLEEHQQRTALYRNARFLNFIRQKIADLDDIFRESDGEPRGIENAEVRARAWSLVPLLSEYQNKSHHLFASAGSLALPDLDNEVIDNFRKVFNDVDIMEAEEATPASAADVEEQAKRLAASLLQEEAAAQQQAAIPAAVAQQAAMLTSGASNPTQPLSSLGPEMQAQIIQEVAARVLAASTGAQASPTPEAMEVEDNDQDENPAGTLQQAPGTTPPETENTGIAPGSGAVASLRQKKSESRGAIARSGGAVASSGGGTLPGAVKPPEPPERSKKKKNTTALNEPRDADQAEDAAFDQAAARNQPATEVAEDESEVNQDQGSEEEEEDDFDDDSSDDMEEDTSPQQPPGNANAVPEFYPQGGPQFPQSQPPAPGAAPTPSPFAYAPPEQQAKPSAFPPSQFQYGAPSGQAPPPPPPPQEQETGATDEDSEALFVRAFEQRRGSSHEYKAAMQAHLEYLHVAEDFITHFLQATLAHTMEQGDDTANLEDIAKRIEDELVQPGAFMSVNGQHSTLAQAAEQAGHLYKTVAEKAQLVQDQTESMTFMQDARAASQKAQSRILQQIVTILPGSQGTAPRTREEQDQEAEDFREHFNATMETNMLIPDITQALGDGETGIPQYEPEGDGALSAEDGTDDLIRAASNIVVFAAKRAPRRDKKTWSDDIGTSSHVENSKYVKSHPSLHGYDVNPQDARADRQTAMFDRVRNAFRSKISGLRLGGNGRPRASTNAGHHKQVVPSYGSVETDMGRKRNVLSGAGLRHWITNAKGGEDLGPITMNNVDLVEEMMSNLDEQPEFITRGNFLRDTDISDGLGVAGAVRLAGDHSNRRRDVVGLISSFISTEESSALAPPRGSRRSTKPIVPPFQAPVLETVYGKDGKFRFVQVVPNRETYLDSERVKAARAREAEIEEAIAADPTEVVAPPLHLPDEELAADAADDVTNITSQAGPTTAAAVQGAVTDEEWVALYNPSVEGDAERVNQLVEGRNTWINDFHNFWVHSLSSRSFTTNPTNMRAVYEYWIASKFARTPGNRWNADILGGFPLADIYRNGPTAWGISQLPPLDRAAFEGEATRRAEQGQPTTTNDAEIGPPLPPDHIRNIRASGGTTMRTPIQFGGTIPNFSGSGRKRRGSNHLQGQGAHKTCKCHMGSNRVHRGAAS